ncbi:RNA dependent RNA polymerase-domain-containing protein [Dactylonectria macrodidyma]|uniref:RNA-dependent RNA polymerase n=1 Tax=Dactylonectria macrodidyma TaxID=307937 RepID=A0A9P9F5A3_9HYPO|nr:RNA dependent RNA polymerase-domain-containing protein [Dactylonectria macrodidyma]
MEVLLRNVPQDMNDHMLEDELRAFMNALGIRDWVCEKPRRKNLGWVHFLQPADGLKFLREHEKDRPASQRPDDTSIPTRRPKSQAKSRDIARLYILKVPVYVEKSTRPIDKVKMSHLRHNREKQAQPSKPHPQEPTPSFRVTGIACGCNVFDETNEALTFVEHTRTIDVLNASARFNSRLLSVFITQRQQRDARIEFYNHTIQDLIAAIGGYSVTLVLTEPPRIFMAAASLNDFVKWERVLSLSDWNSHKAHVATSLVYRITFAETDVVKDVVGFLRRRQFLEVTHHQLPVKPSHLFPYLWDQFKARNKRLKASKNLSFPLLFQVEAMVRNNYLQPSSAIRLLDLMERVALDSLEKKVALPITTDAIKQLLQRIPFPCPGVDPIELDVVELMRRVVDSEYDARDNNPERDRIYGTQLSNHQVWVFKATVTPTRILLSGPDAESRNRVLRMFSNHNDFFLRVMFCDEDGQSLTFNPQVSNERIFQRYRDVLRHGIRVVDRHFSFLGFSHSSLRAHSVWFVAPFFDSTTSKPQTYATILSSLGDFSNIRVPAKYAARVGQAFSETPYDISLTQSGIEIVDIPDVKSVDGSRVFSDGVGTISFEALVEVWSALPIRHRSATCLQIRLGGYKGMVSLDTRLEGKVICLRKESMMKFPSNDLTELGICDTSAKPLQLVLNRQMIKILEDMGVEKSWFFRMQRKALDVFRAVTATAENTGKFLQRQSIGVNMGFSRLVRQLGRMGIDYRRDKFMTSAVESVVLRELRLLKHKARIPIDKGVTLFGVMDETGFLQEGQVYVTFDETSGMSSRSLKEGFVTVTRSPALHPGDIQVAIMIHPPDGHPLRDLQNCIVFSQNGTRDLPSQLSGGDLDGDLYNIIWDEHASPTWVFGPADYPRATPTSLSQPLTRDDIADFFVNFMKTDILGVIATRHVILADMKDDGTKHMDCVSLASMHSTAVDFSKTGIPVELSKLPRAPRFRPDFLATAPPVELYDRGQIRFTKDAEGDNQGDDGDVMAAAKHKYYKSEKILGELFREIDEEKIWAEDIHRNVNTSGPSVWDQLLGLVEAELRQHHIDVDWERKSEEAWKIRNYYDSSISNLMFDYSENPRSALTEVEAFCGFILNKRGGQTRRQRDSSKKLKEEIDRVTAWIVKLIRDRGVGNDDESVASSVLQGSEAAVELCWACVAVGCIKDASASSPLYHGTCELQSFRVVAACCLIKELNTLIEGLRVTASGYVGVGRGAGRSMRLPMR